MKITSFGSCFFIGLIWAAFVLLVAGLFVGFSSMTHILYLWIGGALLYAIIEYGTTP